MSKPCFKCKIVKPLDEFYPHKQMKDGHLNKCKECAKKDVQIRYDDPKYRERISEYEKSRFQSVDRKQKLTQYQRNARAKNPEKYKARYQVSNAIRDGRLFKMPCEYCGNPKAEAHHHDYTKPLDVKWVCFKCHREREHGQILTKTILGSIK